MSQRKQNRQTKEFDASGYRVGIVAAEFNADITDELLASALSAAERCKIPSKNIVVHRVAGSVEIPVILAAMAKSKKFDVLVALGAIIRGETDHYDYVAKMVSDGVLRVTLDYTIPIGFGVLTCHNLAQAKARLHLGGEALEAALGCAKILRLG